MLVCVQIFYSKVQLRNLNLTYNPMEIKELNDTFTIHDEVSLWVIVDCRCVCACAYIVACSCVNVYKGRYMCMYVYVVRYTSYFMNYAYKITMLRGCVIHTRMYVPTYVCTYICTCMCVLYVHERRLCVHLYPCTAV